MALALASVAFIAWREAALEGWVICAARRDIMVVSCAEVGTKDLDQGKLVGMAKPSDGMVVSCADVGTKDLDKGKLIGMAWPSDAPRRCWSGDVATFPVGELFTKGRPGTYAPGGPFEFGPDMAVGSWGCERTLDLSKGT